MFDIPKLKYHNSDNFFLIAGPCVIEGKEIVFEIAEKLKAITDKLQLPFIFKASYRKANRSKLDSFTSIGDKSALEILKSVGNKFDIPTITDIHNTNDAKMVADYVDILQIPAFLCRQTDLLLAAGKTGKPVNIKKGQFLSGAAMRFAVEKVRSTGNDKIFLTDRGNFFGYSDLVVDFRNIPEMQTNRLPVIFDVTHSLQQPNQSSGISGGRPALIETLAKAAIAVGTDGLFIETHPNPAEAKSDGENMLPLDQMEGLLEKLIKIRKAI